MKVIIETGENDCGGEYLTTGSATVEIYMTVDNHMAIVIDGIAYYIPASIVKGLVL